MPVEDLGPPWAWGTRDALTVDLRDSRDRRIYLPPGGPELVYAARFLGIVLLGWLALGAVIGGLFLAAFLIARWRER